MSAKVGSLCLMVVFVEGLRGLLLDEVARLQMEEQLEAVRPDSSYIKLNLLLENVKPRWRRLLLDPRLLSLLRLCRVRAYLRRRYDFVRWHDLILQLVGCHDAGQHASHLLIKVL